VDHQIVTSTEQVGAKLAPTPEPEPTLTLSQWHRLMADAAAYERAQRPIVLHAHPSVNFTEGSPVRHPGIDIPIPTVATTTGAAGHSARSWWPLVFMVSGCTGIGSSVVTAVTSNQYAILAVLASLAAWGTATYHLVFKEN